MFGPRDQEIGFQPGIDVRNNVIAHLEDHREHQAERPALLWTTRGGDLDSVSYGDLATRVEAGSTGLKRLGLTAGDRAFIFVPMSAELYVAMFAVQRIGAIAVFLDSWARSDQLADCAKQVEPRAFIGPEAAFALTAQAPQLTEVPLRIVVGPHEGTYTATLDDLAATTEACPLEPVEGEHPALITFTTGSSGRPKGAERSHRFLCAQHYALDREIPYRDDDIDLPVFPVFALNNLAGGVSTVLPDIDLARPTVDDGARLAAQIRQTGATCSTLSPSLLRGLMATRGEDGLPTLRRVITGGAPVSSDDVRAFADFAPSADLHILYGSTEVEPIAHLAARDMPDESTGEGVCLGRMAEGLAYRFIRPTRDAVELDEAGWAPWTPSDGGVGELIVQGDHVCRGYWRNPEAFARAKIRDREGRIWHRTGDVAYEDAQGRLWMVGRVHSTINRGGELLFPVRPEVLMKRLPFVQAAGYVGVPHPDLGEEAVAVYSVREGHAATDGDEQVLQTLRNADITIDRVVRLDAVPLDPRHHSKVEYTVLRRLLTGDGDDHDA